MDTQGTIAFERTVYQADEEKCLIVAHMSENSIAWKMKIEGRAGDADDETDEHFSMYLFIVDSTLNDWRDLANRQYIVRSDDQTLFPMLPDNPSGAYAGVHYSVNNHLVRLGDRDGSTFQVSWKCDARLGKEHKRRERIEFNGSIAFDGLVVSFDRDSREILDSLPPDCTDNDVNAAYEKWQPDLRKTGLIIAQHLNPHEFDEPLKWRAALRYHLRK